MRNNGWKVKVLIVIAFVIGVVAGISAAMMTPAAYSMYRGLIGFGTIVIVSCLIVFISVKVFHVGE